jgi:hypothetical protein
MWPHRTTHLLPNYGLFLLAGVVDAIQGYESSGMKAEPVRTRTSLVGARQLVATTAMRTHVTIAVNRATCVTPYRFASASTSCPTGIDAASEVFRIDVAEGHAQVKVVLQADATLVTKPVDERRNSFGNVVERHSVKIHE